MRAGHLEPLPEIYILARLKLVTEYTVAIHAGMLPLYLYTIPTYMHACMVGTREQTYRYSNRAVEQNLATL